MANICENKFYITCNDAQVVEKIINKLEEVFKHDLEGEIVYTDKLFIEGYFNSRWTFPDYLFKGFFDEFEDETLYFRCLSEEYGCEYVAMNVYKHRYWFEEQTFDL